MKQVNIQINDLIVPAKVKSHIYDLVIFLDIDSRNYALCKKSNSEFYYLVRDLKIEDIICKCQKEELTGGHKKDYCDNCIDGINVDEYAAELLLDEESVIVEITDNQPNFEVKMNISESSISNFFYPSKDAEELFNWLTQGIDASDFYPDMFSWNGERSFIIECLDEKLDEKISSLLHCNCESCETIEDVINNHDDDDRIKDILLTLFRDHWHERFNDQTYQALTRELEQIGKIINIKRETKPHIEMIVDLKKLLSVNELSFIIIDYLYHYCHGNEIHVTRDETLREILWNMEDDEKNRLDIDYLLQFYPSLKNKEFTEFMHANIDDYL